MNGSPVGGPYLEAGALDDAQTSALTALLHDRDSDEARFLLQKVNQAIDDRTRGQS